MTIKQLKVKHMETATTRTQKDMELFWNKALDEGRVEHYSKFGTVRARLARKGDVVITEIDGVKETENRAKSSDVVVTGVKGEQYLVDIRKFKERYRGPKLTYTDQVYNAVGETYAARWTGAPLKFTASWGEAMIIEPGDYLCSTTQQASGDLYRIERSAFKESYRRK
ncbi:hypothetical protein GR11A_00115 [Vibrio phage vB_VcorM_GR11A]|nr:hypothetical protein GR11A_00115 [Vibrio phage vB_VcorM_GR11A]